MIYQIKQADHLNQTVLLPSSFSHVTIESISFGKRKIACRSILHHEDSQSIYISKDIAESLLLPKNIRIKALVHSETLFLGPVVGIFTAGFYKSLLRPLGDRSIFFSKLVVNGCSTGAFCFVFGIHQIHWDLEMIEGYTFNESGWVKITVPFPNVIYDRLPNRKVENSDYFQSAKKNLFMRSIPLFNSGFFNKWDVHHILSKDETVRHYLPETYHAPSIKTIEQLINRFQMIYLKPENGSLGLGIFKLVKNLKNGSILCCYYDENGKGQLKLFSSIEGFLQHFFTQRSLDQYIAQQGISLLKSSGNPVDFRVHTNKNENGIWLVSAIAAKLAGKGNPTTHVKNGGTIKSLHELSLPLNKEDIYRSLSTAALSISKAIDRKMDGEIGEIGFDFGIDNNGNIWLFEANSKPGRSIFMHKDLQQEDRLTLRFPFQYAEYLMKKTISTEEIYDAP
ncbi:YheC/YheD family protein [Aeribacillus composti]|uniref:YheC/YheD family endospore coat-associated protein n=1 Tax=Aeribacillus composti TaxID=1868734 RepID=UPI002E1BCB80|nr:YheC/YheD family protein [Aeribacillus composti]